MMTRQCAALWLISPLSLYSLLYIAHHSLKGRSTTPDRLNFAHSRLTHRVFILCIKWYLITQSTKIKYPIQCLFHIVAYNDLSSCNCFKSHHPAKPATCIHNVIQQVMARLKQDENQVWVMKVLEDVIMQNRLCVLVCRNDNMKMF